MREKKRINYVSRGDHTRAFTLLRVRMKTPVSRGIRAFSLRWKTRRGRGEPIAYENEERKRKREGKADLTKCQAGKNSQRYYPRHDAKFTRQ